MASRNDGLMYRCADTALVRAARHAVLPLPAWPDLTDDSPGQVVRWRTWLRQVWALDAVAEAIEQASPVLARQIEAMCTTASADTRQMRRTVMSVVRYLLRMTGRATPFGLFAGVAPATFGPQPMAAWGEGHRPVARADARWLSDVTVRLEACPNLLQRLPLMANSAAFVRGGRLIVPYPPRPRRSDRAATTEVSLRFTSAVRIVMEAARTPTRFEALAEKVAAEFPAAAPSAVRALITTLVEHGALISSLHAPSGTLDALGHLVEQVEAAGGDDVSQSADLLHRLREIHDGLEEHNRAASVVARRRLRTALREKMAALSTAADQPVAVDLRLDCSVVLPPQVAREAETAASALARLTAFPFGTPAWQRYHNRFFERYGTGSLVPLRDVVDPDVGLGFPEGFLNCGPEPREPVTARDRRLLALAQEAALDGREEILLDEQLIGELQAGDHAAMEVPPHVELRFYLRSTSLAALARGDFGLTVVSPSRGVGTTTGRFIGLLEPDERARAAAVLEHLPVIDPGSLPVQVSYAPLHQSDAHVTRAPALLPATISIAEHRLPGGKVIPLEDVAVGCDRRRLYLASLSRRCRLEPTILHALDLRGHTPPLARFLAEITRSQAAVVTAFDWGAAGYLPYLPRVRYGRTVLSPARWRLHRRDLPGRSAPWPQWEKAVDEWRTRRRAPHTVALTEGDRLLRLDLNQRAHLAVLRAHLDSADVAVLTEVSANDAWLEGHAHEVVVAMTAARAPRWPTVPPVSAARLLTRDHGHLPGASRWLLVKLYMHVERHPEILGRHLGELFTQWDEPPLWWYLRYRDPRWHLRLRIALPTPSEFGAAAGRVSAWAARLRRHGLLSELQFATSYPETGRWGTGPVMDAAEKVFAADSCALAEQFARPDRPHPQALAAANFVAIAAAFTGSTQRGMDWLIRYGNVRVPQSPDRAVLTEAVRLADPTGGWAALRAAPGGTAILAPWQDRDLALTRYRALLDEVGDPGPDMVLDSLLHAHHLRAAGIAKEDERVCVRLARAAALAWRARRSTR
ncbi:lantibiotic dehydratase [Actinomadura sp. NPDC047616]|uniref:lantibiotic dehydratase n=1 Tax=Actinomadura sp. NPDC047616 TaxID=3155914 RepID=UPI0033DB7360